MELSKKRGVSLITLLILISSGSILFAEKRYELTSSIGMESAYYFPDQNGYNLSDSDTFAPITYEIIEGEEGERNLGSTWGGAELQTKYNITLEKPFLTGGSVLTESNYLKHSVTINLSPVDVGLSLNNTFSPIAFLEFSLGSKVATGWNFEALGAVGLSKNLDGEETEQFGGVYSETWLSGTFQFDLAAVLGGDMTWKHIVFLSNHNFQYKHYTGAEADEPWTYQADGGQNFNGFKYKTSNFIGYQMPLILDMTGILLETNMNLGSNAERGTISDASWGSDDDGLSIGWVNSLKLSEKLSMVIMPQFKRNVRYTDETVKEEYFINREVNVDSPYYWDFQRIAITFSYSL